METDHPDKVYTFDSLFTTNHIQMLKVIAGYLPPPVQGQLAIYIRFLELNYTMRFFRENPFARMNGSGARAASQDGQADSAHDSDAMSGSDPGGSISDLAGIFDEILPYCGPAEKETVQNFQNIFANIQNIREMMQMMDMLREFAPEMSGDNAGGFPGSGADINWPEFSRMMGMIQNPD